MSSEKGGDDLVRGQELETPRIQAEKRVLGLLEVATAAMREVLTVDALELKFTAQSSALRVKLEAAMHVIDGCLGMAQSPGGRQTKDARQLLTAMGQGAVNAELMRRYAQKQQRELSTQRARNAVPAIVDAVESPTVDAQQGSSKGDAHPTTTPDSIDSDASDNAMHRDDLSDGVDNDTTDGGR